jgi:hypothetical protein
MRKIAFATFACVSLLAGCSATGEGGNSLMATALRGGPAPAAEAAAPVVQGTCPPVSLREGTASYRTFAGGEEDPSKIVHQASIAETTRQCTVSGGEIVIEVAAAGRLIVGPAGSTGTVAMPIRVVAVRGDQVLYSELTNYQATLDQQTDQFLFTDPNVRIPADVAKEVQLFVGFDEGPYDTP